MPGVGNTWWDLPPVRVAGSSRCVHCGAPILLMTGGYSRDRWLHPRKIDVPPGQQVWALHCYQAPTAEPEPGWDA